METLDRVATRFRLQELLDEQKPPMSQTDLAKRADVSFATVNRLCTNATAQVSLDTLDKIANALGVTPGDLFEYKPNKKAKR